MQSPECGLTISPDRTSLACMGSKQLNEEKRYCDQVKPFNFLLTCHVRALGHPPGVNPERFQLISPYRQIHASGWGRDGSINTQVRSIASRTAGEHGNRQTARVKTYGDFLEEYQYHPEAKCADADGNVCDRKTIGLLQRRHFRIDQIRCIGKESNNLEEVEAGLEHSQENVYTEYPDPRRDEWETKIRPALNDARLADLVQLCKGRISRRALIDLRAGRSRPHIKNREFLMTLVRGLRLL